MSMDGAVVLGFAGAFIALIVGRLSGANIERRIIAHSIVSRKRYPVSLRIEIAKAHVRFDPPATHEEPLP